MPFEVRMPQLGMNQDSAVIVAWLKAAGDKIATGDPIFEVETDKATMEVEAASDGYLAGLRVAEGADVPVGDVIAMIVATESEVADHEGAAPAETPEPEAKKEAAPEQAPAPEPEPATRPPAPATVPEPAAPPQAGSGKVLASPLAKRLASERGIDLASLRAAGVSEPIHASGLSQATTGGHSQLSARVDGGALNALLDRSEDADRTRLFAAFAAGAWRAVFASDEVVIALRALDGSSTVFPEAAEGMPPALSLVDLCDTRLGSFAPAGGGMTLSTARDGDAYALTLSFNEATLPLPHAVLLLDAIAARVEDPIRQLI